MDFFEHQDEARARTRLLVVLFAAALVALAVCVGVGTRYLQVLLHTDEVVVEPDPGDPLAPRRLVRRGPPDLLLPTAVALGSLALVLLVSAFRWWSLRRGGSWIAASLGARPVRPDTRDPLERRLLNVVEEMALASGTSVPAVFVLRREEGINAFAAGHTVHDAAIGVTRGALEHLSRDELQGVVAHEFSHVLHGDMRLNMRIAGVVAGLVVLSYLGWLLARYGLRAVRGVRGRGSQVALLIPLVGVLVYLVGTLGLLFGHIIRAATSRQREFLADASAVQFTRQPSGIAGALRRIGASKRRGRLRSVRAAELDHIFFESVGAAGMSLGLSTHPPLEERIRRIDPAWDGRFPVVRTPRAPTEPEPRETAAPAPAVARVVVAAAVARAALAPAFDPARVVERVGSPGPEQLAAGRDLLAAIPEPLREAVHGGLGAGAVALGLLLDPGDAAIRARQIETVRKRYPGGLAEEMTRLWPHLAGLGRELRLPTLELASPALQEATADQATLLAELALALAEADQAISPQELALLWALRRRLARALGPTGGRAIASVGDLAVEIPMLLGALVRAGSAAPEAQREAFGRGLDRLPWPPALARPRLPEPGAATELDRCLRRLERGSLSIRRRVLEAAAECVAFDGRLEPDEAELLRALADALDLPLPPFAPA